jgi:hypothetical protein
MDAKESPILPLTEQSWRKLWEVLDHHKKRWTPQHALNRLFGEHYPGVKLPPLSPETATVREAEWSTEQLDATVRPDRETTGPARFDAPVVVVMWKGRPHLVDGRRRVNHWVAVRSSELHPVLIIEPASPAA